MIERGGVTTLPDVTSWASTNKGPTAQRRAFYDGPPAAFAIASRSRVVAEKSTRGGRSGIGSGVEWRSSRSGYVSPDLARSSRPLSLVVSEPNLATLSGLERPFCSP
jgi:hypothetical protein